MADGIDMAGLVDYVPRAELVDAPEDSDPVRAAWLRRRGRGFGASEVAIVLAALDLRPVDMLASYQRAEAHRFAVEMTDGRVAVPRLFMRKAGLKRPIKMTDAMVRGLEREPWLFERWRTQVAAGTAGEWASDNVDPASICYVPDLALPELLPLADTVEPRMLCTPDVFARNVLGQLGCVDLKCSIEPYAAKGGAPACQVVQVNTQMAITGATWGAIVEGEGWSAAYRDRGGKPTGAIRTWPIKRNDALIGEIRAACAEGWQRVEALRAAAMEAA